MVVLLARGGINRMQDILGKARGVRVPTLDIMSWKGTPMAENLFGCYGTIA